MQFCTDWRDTFKLTDRYWIATSASSVNHSVPSLLRSLWMTSFFHVVLGRPDFYASYMGWCPLVKSLGDPVVVYIRWRCPNHCSLRFLYNGVWEHWLFSQGMYIFICDMLWPHNSQDLSSASHIKGIQSGLISFSQTPALSSIQKRCEDTRV